MKNKWFLLTKIQLISLLGVNKAKYTTDLATKKRMTATVVAIVLVGIVLIGYVAMMAFAFCEQGLGMHLPATTIALASLVTLLFSFLNGGSSLFAMKDYDLVMSLPVRKRDVIASRLACIYLADLAFAAAIVIPALIVLFAADGFSLAALAVSLAGMIFAPILPIIVAVALSALFTALTAGFRYKAILQGILGMAAFIGVMAASFSVSFSAGSGEMIDMNALFGVLVGGVYPPALLIEMTLTGEVWAIFVFIGASLAVGAFFVFVLSKGYDRIHTALTARGGRAGYRAKDVKSGSAFAALTRKEFRRLFTSPVYLLNGLCGAVLLLIAGVALLCFDVRSLLAAEELPAGFEAGMVYTGAGLLFFFLGTSCPSAAALSLEGQAKDQLFVLPLSSRTVLLAKAFPTFLIDGLAGLPVAAIFCARMGADAWGWGLLLAGAPVISAFVALFGIWLNARFPRYDWTSETQVVKQSIPMMIAVFVSMGIGVLLSVFSFVAGPWAALIALCACAIATALLYRWTGRAKLI